MRLLVLYRPKSETARAVETFIGDFRRLHEGVGRRMEVQAADSRDGAALMSLYDIMQQPAILVLGDDGQIAQQWLGDTLPLMDEVAAYFYNEQ